MSDHTDSPDAEANPMLDIGDLFAFAGDRGLVLVITVNPLTDPTRTDGLRLDADGLYEFKLDTSGNHVADIAYRVVVSGDRAVQQVTLMRSEGPDADASTRNGTVVATGATSVGAEVAVAEGGNGERLYVGPRQDPFFFNFVGVDGKLADTFRAALSGDGLQNQGSSENTFRPTNMTAIVLEVPMPDRPFDLWAVTSHEGHRIDRCGRPSISAIFLPQAPPACPFYDLHDAFNLSNPIDDLDRFLPVFERTLAFYGSDTTIAKNYLPDVLPVDPGQPIVFPNGRGLSEDPVSQQIAVITPKATKPIGSDRNPIEFLAGFPYLTPPVAPKGGRPGWTPPV